MKYKYLYKIEYIKAKKGQAKYYIGSRTTNIEPEKDLLIKYYTSSKIVNKIIKDEGANSFKIVFIKKFPETKSITNEEALLLNEVDAANNNEYFNQYNNNNYLNIENINIVCPHCKVKNYDNPFAACSNCGKSMIIYTCPRCGAILNGSNAKCECGYCKMDNTKFYCQVCNSILKNPFSRCTYCNYSIVDDFNIPCENCDNMLSNPNERCRECGHSRNDKYIHRCKSCNAIIKTPLSRCFCGYCYMDELRFECVNCQSELKTPNEKCRCGYSKVYDSKFKCQSCGNRIQNPFERCECGFYINENITHYCKNPKCGKPLKYSGARCEHCDWWKGDGKFSCKNCKAKIKCPSSVCDKCGYSVMKNITIPCKSCGKHISNNFEKCECGYSIMDYIKFTCPNCNKLLETSSTRCECGYWSGDKRVIRCKNCNNIITNNGSTCNKCEIEKAGFKNWKDYNKVVTIYLDDNIIFLGYKYMAVQFISSEMKISKDKSRHIITNGNINGIKLKSIDKINKFKSLLIKVEPFYNIR